MKIQLRASVILAICAATLVATSCKKNEEDPAKSSDTGGGEGKYYITGSINGTSRTFKDLENSSRIMDGADYTNLGGGEYDFEYLCGVKNTTSINGPYFQLYVNKVLTDLDDADDLAAMFTTGTDTLEQESSEGLIWHFYYQNSSGTFFLSESAQNSKINITEVTDLGNTNISSGMSLYNNTTRRVIELKGNILPTTLKEFGGSNTVALDTAHFTVRFVSNETF